MVLINRKNRSFLCSLYLALGCIVWFYIFPLGFFKGVLLSFLLVSSLPYFRWENLVGLKYYLLIVCFLCITFLFNQKSSDNVVDILWGVTDNYLFFLLGYHFTRENLVQKKFLMLIIGIASFFCLLTVTNFLFDVPNWISPMEQKRVDNLRTEYHVLVNELRLYSSGFSLGRTGWGHTIALFLPVCLLCKYKKWRHSLIYTICISASVFVSGSRGAFMIIVLLFSLYLYKISYNEGKKKILIFFFLIILSFLMVFLREWFVVHFRLNAGDLTTGRNDQYELIPLMLSAMNFWGLGIGGTYNFLEKFGITFNLHNTYLRIIIEQGFLVGCFLFCFLFHILKLSLKKIIHEKECNLTFCAALIVLSGIISAMMEPNAVFEARAWYVVWWFFYGVLVFKNKNKNAYLVDTQG